MADYRRRFMPPNTWCGARVLTINALPTALPGQLMQQIVSACAFDRVDAELLVQNVNGSCLQTDLIFRAAATEVPALDHRLDSFAMRLRQLLRMYGFDAVAVEEKDDNKLCERLQPVAAMPAGIYYAEPLTEEGRFCPSRTVEAGSVPFAELVNHLAQCPGAAVSLMLQCTTLHPGERQIIRDNLQYFSTPAMANKPYAGKCLNTFRTLQQLDGRPLFFGCISVRFSNEFPRHIGSLMAGLNLKCSMVRFRAQQANDMLVNGAAELVQAAQQQCPPDTGNMHLSAYLRRFAFLMTQEEAAYAMKLPQYGRQLHGMQIAAAAMDHQPISDKLTQKNGIPLGVRFENDDRVYLPVQQLATHASIVGMPGTGKTTAAMGLVYELHKRGYPTLILEPAKTEFRALIDAIPELRIYTPGRSQASPMGLNPFLPPRGVALEQYLPNLTTAFTAAFAMTRPLNVIFPDVLQTCYTRYGWRMSSTRDDPEVTHFGLREFIAVYREAIEKSGYDPESKANLMSGGVYRLTSLINSNPTLYDTDYTLPFDTLLEKPALIELDAVDNTEQKSLLTTLILLNLSLVVREKQIPDGEAKNFIMIDEAHVLLNAHASGGEGDADPAGMAVSLLQNMVMTFRAYGTGVIFADQSPEKLTRSILEFTNVRIAMRLESAPDRELLASTMGMTQGMTTVMRTLLPGQAYFGCRLLDRPIRIRLPDVGKQLNLRHDVSAADVAKRMQGGLLQRPFAACAQCARCSSGCSGECRTEATFLADTLCYRISESLGDREQVLALVKETLPAMCSAAVQELSPRFEDPKRLKYCTMLQMKRRLLLKGPVGLTMQDMEEA